MNRWLKLLSAGFFSSHLPTMCVFGLLFLKKAEFQLVWKQLEKVLDAKEALSKCQQIEWLNFLSLSHLVSTGNPSKSTHRPKHQHSQQQQQQQPHKGAKGVAIARCRPAQSTMWRETLQQWRRRAGAGTKSWRWAVHVWGTWATEDGAPGTVSDPSGGGRQQRESPQQSQSLTQPVLG